MSDLNLKKIKIFVNGNFLSYPTTGVPRYALEICLALKNLGVNLKVLAPARASSHPYFNYLNAKVIGLKNIGERSGAIWEQTSLPRYLRKLNSPMLLNLGNTAPIFYRNQIVTIHDLAFLENPKWFSKTSRLALKFVVPKSATKARAVVTVSEFSKQEIISKIYVEEQKISVIPNSTNLKKSSVNDSFRLPELNKLFILTVCSLNPRKNLEGLLKAFKKLRETEDVQLVLIGEKASAFSQIKELEELVNSLNILHIPRVSDAQLAELYSKASLLVYPSLYEGFGLPPLEAMELGCLPVVSDIPPHREVCGSGAIYFNPYNIDDIAAKIKEGLSLSLDPKKASAQLQKFSWDDSAQKLTELITSLS